MKSTAEIIKQALKICASNRYGSIQGAFLDLAATIDHLEECEAIREERDHNEIMNSITTDGQR